LEKDKGLFTILSWRGFDEIFVHKITEKLLQTTFKPGGSNQYKDRLDKVRLGLFEENP